MNHIHCIYKLDMRYDVYRTIILYILDFNTVLFVVFLLEIEARIVLRLF